MSLTPNFGLNIPDAGDIVNLLTQCYPNFTLIDTAMQSIKETGVTTATETKSGTTHQIVRTVADCNVLRFTATSNFVTGDTFTVDGVPVVGVAVNGASLQTGDFVINSDVLAILNGGKLTLFAGGASAPDASDVSYDNTGSGLTATDVQDAIDELKGDIPTSFDADDVVYDNTGSGLTATNVQDAIDELANNTGGESIEVTADGVKTNAQVLNTLFALLDFTKIKKDTKLIIDTGTEIGYYNLGYTIGTTIAFFSRVTGGTVNTYVENVTCSANSLFVNWSYTANGSMSNVSSSVAPNGRKFKIEY
ncbi:MAG: hypothetical protein J6R32_11325 [Bacteroidales bacterium]|nr:hypothetical protein [Bacteroidales bacterium]